MKLKRNDLRSNPDFALVFCFSMILPENRFPLFGIMLGDGFTLCWREAAIKRLAFVCHIDEKLRRLESLPASFGEIVAHLDEGRHTHAVNVRNGAAGKRRKSETQN